MVKEIEVLDQPDTNFWTKPAYTIPDTPHASVYPGESGVKMVPINRMVPRSFITNIKPGAPFYAGRAAAARRIAFGGDAGVARGDFSRESAQSWQGAQLGKDQGK